MPNYKSSVWSEDDPGQTYPRLDRDLTVDVVVIGAGITGLTTACLLQQVGKKVAVVEARRVGKGETGRSTAHLTEALDTRYHELIHTFGEGGARLAAKAQRAAMHRIEAFVDRLQIDCDYEQVPGYFYTTTTSGIEEIEKEADATHRLGLRTTLTDVIPLPFPVRRALRFEDQAQIHPRKYLLALAGAFAGAGGLIFEETEVRDVEDGTPCRVTTIRFT